MKFTGDFFIACPVSLLFGIFGLDGWAVED